MPLTPQDFVSKWKRVTARERQTVQEHFLDVCALVGHATPNEYDPSGTKFAFEMGAAKTSGGNGWADVAKLGYFGWEYKGKDADLDKAYEQLLRYRDALQNPPILIVSDINRIIVRTNYTNLPTRTISLTLDDLLTTDGLKTLKAIFFNPDELKPRQTVQSVTEEAARQFSRLAGILRKYGEDPQTVAHFLIRLLFCLFAEDVGLLPDRLFPRLLEQTRRRSKDFAAVLQVLFQAMSTGGYFGAERIPHFNGGLFNDNTVLELDSDGLDTLAQIDSLDWAAIEPSIFGTLFERGLDPSKRSQLGAHYTSRDDILLIVEPVLMAPLLRQWEQLQAEVRQMKADAAEESEKKRAAVTQKIGEKLRAFADQLAAIQVLDPACGSGNFLYVALRRLLDLQHQVIALSDQLGAGRFFISVSPSQLHGIEINEYAHELAQVTIWIGYIQWLAENGYGLPSEPILKPMQNIQHMDAILATQQPPSLPPPQPSPKMGEGVPPPRPSPKMGEGVLPSPILGEGPGVRVGDDFDHWNIPESLRRNMVNLAREFRKTPTRSEAILWQALRGKRLDGVKFRRQQNIGPFVVDFYASEHRLIVEIDGPIHETQQRQDAERQKLLESLGLRFVRVPAKLVENDLNAALEMIRSAIAQQPPPQPSPKMVDGAPPPRPSPKMGEEVPPSLILGEGPGVRAKEWAIEPTWPAADVIIGNPPFLGGNKIRAGLGDEYVDALFKLYEGRVPAFADLVCYWFEKARALIETGQVKRAGLLATNSIRGGANRKVLERIKQSGDIFWAQSDREWVLDGAAVNVSMVGFDNGTQAEKWLDHGAVTTINPDLTALANLATAHPLPENAGICFMGPSAKAPFDIEENVALQMLADTGNPNGKPNADVVRPVASAIDLVQGSRRKWTLDFGLMEEEQAAEYEKPFEYVKKVVLPVRQETRRDDYRGRWWQYARPRIEMRAALQGKARFIATPGVSKHRIFVWMDAHVLCNQGTLVFARDDDYFFGVLHSKVHEIWALKQGTSLEDRPRYTPTSTFETFPFPWPPGHEPAADPRLLAIAQAAKNLDEKRQRWLNPPSPPAPLPSGEGSAPSPTLGEGRGGGRTLTNLYNTRPTWLQLAHQKLDAAVFAAYGWPPDLSDEQILERLLALNLERA
jgi:very-short-patch-repair endonuclease/type II restriction/modification system DNA methylase subunit YeeA